MTNRLSQYIASLLFVLLAASSLALSTFPPHVTPRPLTAPFVTDMSGSRVHIGAPPRRVIFFAGVLAPYLTLDNDSSHVIAATRGNLELVRNSILGNIVHLFGQDAEVGSTYIISNTVEEVMRLHPDVVFSWWVPGQDDPLKAANLPGIVEITWGHRDSYGPDHEDILKLIGQITGKNDKALFLIDDYARRRQEVIAALPRPTAPPVRVGVMNGSSFALLSSNKQWMNEILKVVNAKNSGVAISQNFSFDPEELIRLNPEVILYFSSYRDDVPPNKFYAKPEFQSLRAIRNRHVYRVPEYAFTNPYLEGPLMLDWLAEVLFPDAMPRRLRTEYRETYRDVFHYALSEGEIDKAIYLKENLQSAGYERFAREAAQGQNQRLPVDGHSE
jgi:iron complex transport system substrate-binding protein